VNLPLKMSSGRNNIRSGVGLFSTLCGENSIRSGVGLFSTLCGGSSIQLCTTETPDVLLTKRVARSTTPIYKTLPFTCFSGYKTLVSAYQDVNNSLICECKDISTINTKSDHSFHTSNILQKLTWDEVLSEKNRKKCITVMKTMNRPRKIQSNKPVKKTGAVLIPMCHVEGELCFLYTERSKHLSSHRGEVSFPGGMTDPGDKDVQETALRETCEEIGIPHSQVDVWGQLPPVPGRDGDTNITPVLGYIREFDASQLVLSEAEVDHVFAVSLKNLANSNHTHQTQFRSKKFKNGFTLPLFTGSSPSVWGFTAIFTHMVLSCLLPGIYKHKLHHISAIQS
ncbi:unnamed protein product, partial [Meganyctiphanes norvegica]